MFSHTDRSEIYKSKIHGPSLGALALNLTMQPSHDFLVNLFQTEQKFLFPIVVKRTLFLPQVSKRKSFLSLYLSLYSQPRVSSSPHPHHINCLQKGDKQKYFHPFFSLLYIKAIVRKKKNEAGKGQQNKAFLQRLQVPHVAYTLKK